MLIVPPCMVTGTCCVRPIAHVPLSCRDGRWWDDDTGADDADFVDEVTPNGETIRYYRRYPGNNSKGNRSHLVIADTVDMMGCAHYMLSFAQLEMVRCREARRELKAAENGSTPTLQAVIRELTRERDDARVRARRAEAVASGLREETNRLDALLDSTLMARHQRRQERLPGTPIRGGGRDDADTTTAGSEKKRSGRNSGGSDSEPADSDDADMLARAAKRQQQAELLGGGSEDPEDPEGRIKRPSGVPGDDGFLSDDDPAMNHPHRIGYLKRNEEKAAARDAARDEEKAAATATVPPPPPPLSKRSASSLSGAARPPSRSGRSIALPGLTEQQQVDMAKEQSMQDAASGGLGVLAEAAEE